MTITFRQQIRVQDNEKLAFLLNIQSDGVRTYDVLVFPLCKGNISKRAKNGLDGRSVSLSHSISICNQLLEGLLQLERSGTCHNDLKPENILFDWGTNDELEIFISDFGQVGRTGERTTIENQGNTEFCWLFSLANSILSSLRVRLG